MDPQACWNELQEAVATAMWGTAIERAEALLEWLGREGFPPQIGPYPVFNRITQTKRGQASLCRFRT